ncbi:MAG: hypothetical protein UHG68_07100 [Clostridia bacterium]|nr:hypothetical protein [Clostridia bacterium]
MTETYNAKAQKNSVSVFSDIPISASLTIRYALFYVIFFTLGLIGYYVVKLPFSDTLNGYITSYFSYSFELDKSISDNIAKLICVSYSDIRTLFLIFVGGFTMFSSAAIYGLLFYHALSLGFSALYLVNSMSAGLLSGVSFINLVFFLFSNAAVCAVIIIFSSKTRIFNDEFKRLGGRKKLIVKSKALYLQIFTLFAVCGAVLFVNIIRFLINSFITKG